MRADDGFDLGKDRDDLGPGDDGGAVGIGVEVDGVVASLVAGLASVVVQRPVQEPGVFEELQAEVDRGHDSFVGELGCGDEVLGLSGLSIESLLAPSEVALVDEAFHPGVEELLPLGFKATEALVLGLDGEV